MDPYNLRLKCSRFVIETRMIDVLGNTSTDVFDTSDLNNEEQLDAVPSIELPTELDSADWKQLYTFSSFPKFGCIFDTPSEIDDILDSLRRSEDRLGDREAREILQNYGEAYICVQVDAYVSEAVTDIGMNTSFIEDHNASGMSEKVFVKTEDWYDIIDKIRQDHPANGMLETFSEYSVRLIGAEDVGYRDLKEEIKGALADGAEVECASIQVTFRNCPNRSAEGAEAVFFPNHRRAGVAWGADAFWYDARSLDEAIEKWFYGEPE